MSLISSIKQRAKFSLATILRKTGRVEARCKQGGVIILMLHKVNDQYDPLPITLKPILFDRMLTEIKSAGYEIVAIDDLFDTQGTFIGSDKLKFVITFDDGYLDNFEEALPIMQKHNIPSTIYLSHGHVNADYRFWYELMTNGIYQSTKTELDLTDMELGKFSLTNENEKNHLISELNYWLKEFNNEKRNAYLDKILNRLEVDPEDIPTSRMMNWDMIRNMQDVGVNFGSHTLSHPILSKESLDIVEKEVGLSKQLIEEELSQEITGFAYPNGTYDDYNSQTIEAVRSSGYVYACSTNPGINEAGEDPYQLKRINLFNGMCSDQQGSFHPDFFWAKITNCF